MHQPTLQELGEAIVRASPHRAMHAAIAQSKLRTSIALMLSDTFTLCLVMVAVVLLRSWGMSQAIPIAPYAAMIGAIVIGNLLASTWRGIYPGYGLCAIAEMRSTFYTLTGVFALIIAISFFTRGVLPYSRSILLAGWVVSVPALFVSRMIARQILSSFTNYGIPAIVVGPHSMATKIVDTLRIHGRIGLRPIAIVEPDEETAEYGYHEGVPVIGGLKNIASLTKRYGVTHGVVAMPHSQGEALNDILDQHGHYLSHITFVGEHVHPSVVWISNSNTEVLLSAEVEQRLKQPALRFKKRVFDICCVVPLIILSAPLFLFISLAIKLSSRGPVIYTQERVGRHGHLIKIFKFRTMVENADQILSDVLQASEERRNEWYLFHKLKDDPRITWIGKLLRKYSLDELPQFFNVLRGDMTLVGYRPFLPEETANLLQNGHRMYLNMCRSSKPGLTGLWQVTVRSDAEFLARAHIDLYYTRNWSLFLDIYILLRTVGVVVTGRGGY